MAEDGRRQGRRGWVQTAIAWVFGPQQEQHRWQQAVWQTGERERQSAPLEAPTQRQGAMLAQARAADPPWTTVPVCVTPQTPPLWLRRIGDTLPGRR
jgi:hypothetical protein